MTMPKIVKAMKPKSSRDWVLVRGDYAYIRFLATNDPKVFELQTPTRPEDPQRYGSEFTNGYYLPRNMTHLFEAAELIAPGAKTVRDRWNNEALDLGTLTLKSGETIQDYAAADWVIGFFERFDKLSNNKPDNSLRCDKGGISMSEIYSDLGGDGADVYLSDGMYLRPDGSMYER